MFEVEESIRLDCEAADAWMPTPPETHTVILDAVALPLAEDNSFTLLPGRDEDTGWYAVRATVAAPKQGGAFTVTVPEAYRDRVVLWRFHSVSGTSRYTWQVETEGCERSDEWVDDWLQFWGGFVLREPSCFPLLISDDSVEQLVHIKAGAPCT